MAVHNPKPAAGAPARWRDRRRPCRAPQNAERLDSEIIYDRDFDYDYFGFKVRPRAAAPLPRGPDRRSAAPWSRGAGAPDGRNQGSLKCHPSHLLPR